LAYLSRGVAVEQTHFWRLCPSDALGNCAEWAHHGIRNEKRPSHAGNLPRAGIVDGKPTSGRILNSTGTI
jgi:hypothetical protein